MTGASRLHPGSIIGGKYRLEAPLARGGMGSVWRAEHVELAVPVAIKFMEGAFASTATAESRFAREAKAAAALRHPNIVDVRDYGVDAGLPYLVMELLAGEDLGARLKRTRRLSILTTSAIVAQVARALRRAHETGIVHRDLKPGNVFLAKVDDDEVVKLLDFGIAKDTLATAAVGESTRTGELMGSPHYMSPEQIRGAKDLDLRSDLWALGVIVFRALTGRLPFHGDSMGAVMGQILADPIPAATSVAPDLPPEVDAFFARVLVRDRSARFSSAREMAAALSSAAGAAGVGPSVSAVESPSTSGPLSVPITGSGPLSVPITGSGPLSVPITGSGPLSVPITGSGPLSAPITGSGPLGGSGAIRASTPVALVETRPPASLREPERPAAPPEPPQIDAPSGTGPSGAFAAAAGLGAVVDTGPSGGHPHATGPHTAPPGASASGSFPRLEAPRQLTSDTGGGD